VAIALRNRWRAQQVRRRAARRDRAEEHHHDRPTGVGKTEIARRLAKLAQAPFLKVEASKFTEVGYVGRDVESIVRDLTEVGVALVTRRSAARCAPRRRSARGAPARRVCSCRAGAARRAGAEPPANIETREKLRQLLRQGRLDEREVELELEDATARRRDQPSSRPRAWRRWACSGRT
jgi:ATP-dependent HslUV protease ATP-binding subunit HslU